jgi:hypothetical protein
MTGRFIYFSADPKNAPNGNVGSPNYLTNELPRLRVSRRFLERKHAPIVKSPSSSKCDVERRWWAAQGGVFFLYYPLSDSLARGFM